MEIVLRVARRLLRRAQRLHLQPHRIRLAGRLLREPLDVALRVRRERPEAGADDAVAPRVERREVVAEEVVDLRRRAAVQVCLDHAGHLLEELLPVAVGGVGPVFLLDAPDAGELGIDVIELVHHRVDLRDPRIRAGIELLLARTIERLVAEARQRERDHVLDVAGADGDRRRFRDEPLRAARQLARRSIAPEVIARFAGRQRQAMTRRERALRIRSTGPRKHQHVAHVDERERRHAGHHVLHQDGKAIGVIHHVTHVAGGAMRGQIVTL